MEGHHGEEERLDEKEALLAIFDSDICWIEDESNPEQEKGGSSTAVHVMIRPTDITSLCHPTKKQMFVPLQEIWNLNGGPEDVKIEFRATLSRKYPATPAVLEIVDRNNFLSAQQVQSLEVDLNLAAHRNRGTCNLYEIIMDLCDSFQDILKEHLRSFNSSIVLEPNGQWRYRRRTEISNVIFDEASTQDNDTKDQSCRSSKYPEQQKQQECECEDEVEDEDEDESPFDWECEYDSLLAWLESQNRDKSRKKKPPSNIPKDAHPTYQSWKEEVQRHDNRRPGNFQYGKTTIHPSLFVAIVPIFRALQEAGLTVLGIENILRKDLAQEFISQWAHYGRQYGTDTNRQFKTPQHLHWPFKGGCGAYTVRGDVHRQNDGIPMAQPVMAFHGTRHESCFSIVQNGLVQGGSNGVHIRCGQAYGAGVYCSPDPIVATNYAEGHYLIVCAILMGDTQSGMDSTTDRTGFREWIILNRYAILPCWIVEIDFNKDSQSFHLTKAGNIVKAEDVPTTQHPMNEVNVAEIDYNDLQRKASFWFGNRFKALEMAPRDDDDDEHGGRAIRKVYGEADVVSEYGYYMECRRKPRDF